MNIIARYASLVKFSHTFFALPFALVGYVYALCSTETPFEWMLLLKILLCMVFARNAAMGFNRWSDRRIDALNPRTAAREIPAGTIQARSALWFVITNSLLFIATAGWINLTALLLSPIALLVLLGYSYTKHFTAWCHIILGVALGIAPVGAYIAVTGQLAVFPVILSGLVVSWVSGFDILYALQDAAFDREQGLHSIPARFTPKKATGFSIALHAFSAWAVLILGLFYGAETLYWIGATVFIALLIVQHILFRPSRLDRIGASFGLVNGLSSTAFAAFAIADLLVKYVY